MDALFQQSDLEFSDENRLDLEFRQILCIIKRYIPYVNSNYQLSLYRSWLEKLSGATDEKIERNRFLLELARQIKSNSVSPPFDQRPPAGSLQNFQKINYYLYNPENQLVKNNPCPLDDELGEIPPPMSSSHNCYRYSVASSETSQSTPTPTPSPSRNLQDTIQFLEKPDNFYYRQYQMEKEHKKIPEKTKIAIKSKKKKPKFNETTSKDFLVNIEEQTRSKYEPQEPETVEEDSSWCDITDTSVSSLKLKPSASGDFQEFSKSNSNNESTRVQNGSKMCEPNNNTIDKITEAHKPVQETEVKYSLKDTNFISADWKKTIEALQLRLTETLNQNNELKLIIDNLKAELKFEILNKDQSELKRKRSADLHNKEIEIIKKLQEENLKKMEVSFDVKFDEAEKTYQKKLEDIRIHYEKQIRELKIENDNARRVKDKEIARLTHIIQEECKRMSNEIVSLRNYLESSTTSNTNTSNNGDERIFVLQKCVSKMDRLFHKSEKEYMKQIEKLKQDLELKERVTRIQLKTQRAELIARTCDEKQKQFDEIVNNLEVKYIKMLEYHEKQVADTKRQDDEKIFLLKDLLDQHNISYNI